MKYFKVFLNKGNSEVHGQRVYKNILTHSSKEFTRTFSQPLYWENLKYLYTKHRLYLDFEHIMNMVKH